MSSNQIRNEPFIPTEHARQVFYSKDPKDPDWSVVLDAPTKLPVYASRMLRSSNDWVSYGSGDAYSIGVIIVMKAYYEQSLNFICALLIVLTTHILGYDWTGMLRKYLVDPSEMWWHANITMVSLFRALNEMDSRSKGFTRMQFFLTFMVASFTYYTLPRYLFPILTFFSWVCWAWPHNITAQQIGSGYHGLGVRAFTLDLAGISAYHGNPLVAPWFSIFNANVGFIMFIYIIVPLCY
ncbi:hypothetical protein GIB67_019651 [Kingdonia uniflora]|uniref:Uncharacterized protein n=1 Tax=Kingdonia uniflora TaxID=39325 RepID=A0A7J7P4A9_9MAGN|nr:hypothetical protein GIB67_019651 [Kingdonia uniflora]